MPWVRDRWTQPFMADGRQATVLLTGCEANWDGSHIGLLGIPEGAVEGPQVRPLRAIARTRAAGGFVFLAHPGDFNGNADNLAALKALQDSGLELITPAPEVAAEWREAVLRSQERLAEEGAFDLALLRQLEQMLAQYRSQSGS